MSAALLVIGATGRIGRGVVRAALEAGVPVVAAARDRAALAALRAAHPGADLATVAASVASDAEAGKLAQALRERGRPLAGVVAALGGPAVRGRLLDHPAAALGAKLDADLLPHLAAARALLPLLAAGDRGGGYVIVGGPGSALPWCGYGHRSVAAAALRMLAAALHVEARGLGVRLQLLAVDAPARDDTRHSCPEWPSALAIGQRALALLARADARDAHRAVVTFAPPRPATAPGGRDADSALRDARRLLQSLSPPDANEVSP